MPRDRTDKVKATSDQAVMVPSASSESIAALGGAALRGLSDTSWSSKLSAIWNAVGRFRMSLQIKVWKKLAEHTYVVIGAL